MKWTDSFVNQAVSNKLDDAVRLLQNAGCTEDQLASLQRLKEPGTSSWKECRSFDGLHSQYFQRKHFVEKLGLVKPEILPLEQRVEDFGRVKTGRGQQIKQQSMVYIPLPAQLEKFLNKNDIHYQIFERPIVDRDEEVLSCFVDGFFFKNSDFLRSTLELYVYTCISMRCNFVIR